MLTMQLILLLAGLALVIFGADFLVDGATTIARKLGLSEFVIGLTIVGFGTSCPELVVSVTGALQGSADIAVGNVVGSNIFNTLLILGITTVIAPVAVTSHNRRIDIPLTAAVTLIFSGLYFVGVISRWTAVLFLLLFAAYLFYCFKFDKSDSTDDVGERPSSGIYFKLKSSLPGAVLLVAAGLAGLIFGGRMFVDSACELARAAGVSEKFIAITLLAAGTSLPELATGIVAAAKGKAQLALGNILGSNVFNILLILGVAAAISPLSMSGMTAIDLGALVASAVMLCIWTYSGTRNRIDRWEGALMLLAFAAYYVYLFIAA